MRLAHVLAAAAAAAAPPPRGFLLVATNLPVQLLRRDADADWRRDELGCVLRDICAQEKYPATVVVGDANEVATVERNRPCDRVVARLLPDGRRLNLREDGSIFPMRLFKVRAIAAFCNVYAEGTLYIDNDVQLRLPVVDDLFGIFDTMLSQGKTVGILKDPGVPPGHEVADIPEWSGAVRKSKFYGAFVLNCRACSMAWRCRFLVARRGQHDRVIGCIRRTG